TLPESSFRNLSQVEFLGLSENNLEEIPRHILQHMPYISTLDLGICRIRKVYLEDLRSLKYLRNLVLVSNHLSMLEKDSLPHMIRYLHLGRNNLTSLNGTLRELQDMEVLFINDNHLQSLDDELPPEFRNMTHLDSLYFNDNKLVALDGVFMYGSNIEALYAFKNRIEYLAEDEFLEAERMEVIDLGYNYIKSLNGSLKPLKNLRQANFTNNLLEEFSMNDIRGLKYLKVIDLSYNRIEKLTGKMENIVEPDSFIYELRLEHNLIKTLDGSLMGLNKLQVLSLSHNLLRVISPDDLIGLEELEILDISHNDLQTLEETSKSFLPKLEKLDASYNNLTKLEKDFHGLPVLCLADLSNNRITSISPELVAKTRCSIHGVLNKLEILLQENPILCHDELPVLIAMMEAQEARLLGIAHCIIRQPEIAANSQIFLTPPIPLLPILKAQIPIIPNNIMHPSPSIVQVIMPAPIILQPAPSETETVSIDVQSFVEVTPATTVLLTTVETDNSVDENFSPVPQVMGPSPDRAQQLLEPEEPPALFHDESVPTK
ncbi:Leucine-rich repeat-containing protein 15, partial [Pseudolycoriella hygida]